MYPPNMSVWVASSQWGLALPQRWLCGESEIQEIGEEKQVRMHPLLGSLEQDTAGESEAAERGGSREMMSGIAKYGTNHGAAGVSAAAPAPPYTLLRLHTSAESTCLSTTPLAGTSFRVTRPGADENPPSFQPANSFGWLKTGCLKLFLDRVEEQGG